jgi:hypothetical protein
LDGEAMPKKTGEDLSMNKELKKIEPTWIEELEKIADTLKPIGYEVVGYKDHLQVGEGIGMITVNLKRNPDWPKSP